MVLSNVNVAKTSGNGSSSVIRKIHNMPWLKQATDPKNSDQGKATGGAMFNPLSNLKEDEPAASQKKSKRRNRKSRNSKQRDDVPKNTKIMIESKDPATRTNARGADDLVTKDSQLSVAGGQPGVGKGIWSTDKNTVGELFPGAAEAARNEQLEDEELQRAVAASLETAFREKCAIDPPEEDNAEAVKLSDEENIWDGVHKNLPLPSGEENVVEFDANNNSGSNKSPSSSVATRKSDAKMSTSEGSKAATIGTASVAGKTDEPLAPAIVPNFIDKFGRVDGCSEKHLYMGKGARAKEAEYRRSLQQHGNSANGSNQKPRNNVGSQDQRSRNARQHADDSRNDNRGAGNGPNDPHAHFAPDGSRRSRQGRPFRDHARNDVGGPSPQTVIAQLQSGSHPCQAAHRPRNHHADEDSRNDRQQRRFSGHENPDSRHNHREPFDHSKKNPYKYIREPNDQDKRICDKSDEEHANRTEDANREGDEKKIQPLKSTTVEPPKELQINIEPGVLPKESTESTGEPVKPQVHLKDFNSRYNTPPEQTTLQTRPNPACSTTSFHSPTTIGHSGIADASCQTSGIQFPPAHFTVPPPGFGCLENTQRSSDNAAYILPVDSSLGGSAYVVPADSTSDSFSEMEEMEAVYTRIKMYDPMLYDILMKKRQRPAALQSVQMNAVDYPTISENCNVLPVDPRSLQATSVSYDVPAKQRCSEPLNPNAKQYSPISKQPWITNDQQDPISCYSVLPSYDLQSAGVCCPHVGQHQDMTRQDSSGWILAGPQQLYAPVPPAQHHVHYASEPIAPIAPTAILGRQSYLVSEQNLPYKNAQRPMNLQQLNDDCTIRYQPSDFDDISTDPERQMQYLASQRQCGGAPSQFCSMPCEGSYGNQTTMSKFGNYAQQPQHPLHQYADFFAKNRNSMNSMNQGNQVYFCKNNDELIRGFAQPGCGAHEQISINQQKLRFVQPIIPPMSVIDKNPGPGKGRGTVRRNNK